MLMRHKVEGEGGAATILGPGLAGSLFDWALSVALVALVILVAPVFRVVLAVARHWGVAYSVLVLCCYSNFNTNKAALTFQGNSKVLPSGVLDLTDPAVVKTVGRVLYKIPVPLWNRTTGNVASFLTNFSFTMIDIPNLLPADGIIFFLAPNTDFPSNSEGGLLGVVDGNRAYNEFVGVEFDTYQNEWDPSYITFWNRH
ncbi:lectin [Trifolium medium]|uniref:Lectin n=1 Tax=Trifolium medium TaxID=97028 RepID=A0A392M6T8_9FABA|nr:lectin [Trifolium medium]